MPSATARSDNPREIVAVDLFCGAGGFSEGLRQACEDLGYRLRHAAVNHWEPAIETHERNHPDAHQYHSKVEQLHPPEVIDALVDEDVTDVHASDVDVDLLVAGPECTHFSSARGGKPVSEQKRMSPWHVLDWLEKLDVDAFLIENVGEIQSWGPVEDGQPSRDGTVFDAWINALNQLGYSVEWTTLNAADYGDPTSRERFFLVGRQGGKATFPDPTHSDEDPELPNRRTAADIIDWTDLGESIWTRDLTQKRVHTPPKDSTMQRIAEGIRRHCDDALAPFADVLETLGRDEIRSLRDSRVIPAEYAGVAADALDEPFLVRLPETASVSMPSLVKYYGTSPPQPVSDPLDTVTSGGHKYALSTAETILLRQQDGGPPWSVHERPVPTIAKRGGHSIVTTEPTSLVMPRNGPRGDLHSNSLYPADARPIHTVTAKNHDGYLVSPYLCPLYNSRDGQRPRTRAVDRPLMTVPASKSPAGLATPAVTPYLDDYEGPEKAVGEPLGTVTTRDRFALCVPELWPWGLDVKYRMLQPRELQQAQGFPADYDIAGAKKDQTAQIGNAVPVHLAKTLCKHVLTAEDPSLASFGGGITPDQSGEVRDYEEVVSDD